MSILIFDTDLIFSYLIYRIIYFDIHIFFFFVVYVDIETAFHSLHAVRRILQYYVHIEIVQGTQYHRTAPGLGR